MNYIVLGRFQPLHNGHVFLIEKALDLAGDDDKVLLQSVRHLVKLNLETHGQVKKERDDRELE